MSNQSLEVVEQWRAEFERLVLQETPHENLTRDTGHGDSDMYEEPHVHNYWQGFLLARSTVEIELPEPLEFDDGHDEPSRHYWPTQIKNAIKSQGYQVSVKGE